MTSREGDLARGASEVYRGARGAKVSARGVVRLAQRVLRKEKWQSFEITSSCDVVSVRVHRAPTVTTTTSSEPSAKQCNAQKTERRNPAAIAGSARQRKSIRYQRHGCLSKLVKYRLTRCALAVHFVMWRSIARQLTTQGMSVADDEMREDGASSPPVGGASGSSGEGAPKRARDSPTKAMAVRE